MTKGKKDINKLVPVRRTVTRDGKTYETTVYISQNQNMTAKNEHVHVQTDVWSGIRSEGDLKKALAEIKKCPNPATKEILRDEIVDFMDRSGVEWEKHEDKAINYMRCMMKVKRDIKNNQFVPEGSGLTRQETKYKKLSREKSKQAMSLLKKRYSNADIHRLAEQHGIQYKKCDHEGINHMRCMMAIREALEDGNGFEPLNNILNLKNERYQEKKKNEITPRNTDGSVYFDVDEKLAEQARYSWSFFTYVKGSTTDEYRAQVDKAFEIANNLPDEYKEKGKEMATNYSKKMADWYNQKHHIDLRCPSIMIAGGSNFDVRRKEKQNRAMEKHYELYEQLQKTLDRIKNLPKKDTAIKTNTDLGYLKSKLQELESAQSKMKRANAYYRKHGTLKGCEGFTDVMAQNIENAMKKYHDAKPYSSWQLTNNNNRIKTLQSKIENLEKAKDSNKDGAVDEFKNNVFEVIQNTDMDRIQLKFDGVPEPEVRQKLKKRGFRWSPKNKVWQRQLTENARHATRQLIQELDPDSAKKNEETKEQTKQKELNDNGGLKGSYKNVKAMANDMYAILKGKGYKTIQSMRDIDGVHIATNRNRLSLSINNHANIDLDTLETELQNMGIKKEHIKREKDLWGGTSLVVDTKEYLK